MGETGLEPDPPLDAPRRKSVPGDPPDAGRHTGHATSRQLPEDRGAFLREVLRRLALLDREIRALTPAEADGSVAPPGPALLRLEMVLRVRLRAAEQLNAGQWPAARGEIAEMWRRFRTEFERQALLLERSHAARRGPEEEGPSR